MSKSQEIQAQLQKPIKVGDYVDVRVPYKKIGSVKVKGKFVQTSTDTVFYLSGDILKIIDSPVHGLCYDIESYSHSIPSEIALKGYEYDDKVVKAEFVKQNTFACGANPFKRTVDVRFYNNSIESILSRGGYGRKSDLFNTPDYNHFDKKEDGDHFGKTYGGINFNPYVTTSEGVKYYQRPLVWTKHEKQLLISSIYNGIEIGKFLFKYHAWAHIEKEVIETGHGFNFDCVDGKQRFHAILEFVQNKFPDEYGNFFEDLSANAQRRFLNYDALTVGELSESASEEDVLTTFLTLNFTGAPMSEEHIEYIKGIRF